MNTGPKLNPFRRVNVRYFNYSVAGKGGVLVACEVSMLKT